MATPFKRHALIDFGENRGGAAARGNVRGFGGRVPIEWNRHHGPSAFTVT
jgi:hypothetical protein